MRHFSVCAREPVVTLRTDGDHLWFALLDTTGRLRGYFTGGSEQHTVRTAAYWYAQGNGPAGPARLY